ncbi:hypothetical protein GIB67_008545 [Kingdonia uniflora]|uniref:CWF21 domain-containing protein n=1 Tax=Kingdonia uniflora TaxID=39325 RepID=A0A7J7N3Y9_9MAGN|nr:hypothetical protein GIB67_008545 [Kingdonia uniflora]
MDDNLPHPVGDPPLPHPERGRFGIGVGMKSNKDILEKDRKRQIQLKLLLLQDNLTDKGYTDDEISLKLDEARCTFQASDAPLVSDYNKYRHTVNDSQLGKNSHSLHLKGRHNSASDSESYSSDNDNKHKMTVSEARDICQNWWMKEALDVLVYRISPLQGSDTCNMNGIMDVEYVMLEYQNIRISYLSFIQNFIIS